MCKPVDLLRERKGRLVQIMAIKVKKKKVRATYNPHPWFLETFFTENFKNIKIFSVWNVGGKFWGCNSCNCVPSKL